MDGAGAKSSFDKEHSESRATSAGRPAPDATSAPPAAPGGEPPKQEGKRKHPAAQEGAPAEPEPQAEEQGAQKAKAPKQSESLIRNFAPPRKPRVGSKFQASIPSLGSAGGRL